MGAGLRISENCTDSVGGAAGIIWKDHCGLLLRIWKTGRVAEYVADELGADTFEIIPVNVYSDEDLNWRDRSAEIQRENDHHRARS